MSSFKLKIAISKQNILRGAKMISTFILNKTNFTLNKMKQTFDPELYEYIVRAPYIICLITCIIKL